MDNRISMSLNEVLEQLKESGIEWGEFEEWMKGLELPVDDSGSAYYPEKWIQTFINSRTQ